MEREEVRDKRTEQEQEVKKSKRKQSGQATPFVVSQAYLAVAR